MNKILKNNEIVLIEAAIIEQLRRSGKVILHPILANAPLIYDEYARSELRKIYQGYINISLDSGIPFLMCTPTWRANLASVSKSDVPPSINVDTAYFLQEIRSAQNQAMK